MAIVDFIWQPNASRDFTYVTGRQYMTVAEGTGVSNAIPLTFTISAAQATDTVVRFGLGRASYSDVDLLNTQNRHDFSPDVPNTGRVDEQYDVGELVAVIPAGQTSVVYHLPVSGDNQAEGDEYFNLYISSVSGGHTIEASDLQANQSTSFFTSPTSLIAVNNSVGYNTIAILDDDGPNGSNILTSGNDVYVIPDGVPAAIFAGAGDDRIIGSSGADTILGHDGNDTIFGNGGNDAIHGGDGVDTIHGDGGSDVIFGGLGADMLYGDDGDDVIWGDGQTDNVLPFGDGSELNYSRDLIYGGAGNDTILGQGADDLLYGDGGNDAISGGNGNDTVTGGDGSDVVFGGAGADTIFGGVGDDVLWGEDDVGSAPGNDGIDGGAGNDTILGQGGVDTLFGGAGNDAISGGDDQDYLLGGSGADILAGGNGADTFAFGLGDGGDIVIDLNAGGVRDVFDLRACFDAIGYGGNNPRGDGLLAVYQYGSDTHVYLQGELFLTLQGVTAAAIDDGYFLIQ